MNRPLRVAIVGSGCSGLAAAYALHRSGHDIKVFEKDAHVGGHAHTQYVGKVPVDTGFMVCNHVTYPTMLKWFEDEGVAIQASDMSLSVSLEDGAWEWGSEGLGGLFARRHRLCRRSTQAYY
jgi:predicted NAD/FAD-binding protein